MPAFIGSRIALLYKPAAAEAPAPPANPVNYLGFNSSATNTTLYNFTSSALGTADGDRLIVVLARLGVAVGGVSSISVGGTSLTSVGAMNDLYVFAGKVATGTSATIAVTLSGGNAGNCTISWYSMITTQSAPSGITSENISSGVPDSSLSVTVASGGGYIAFGFTSDTADRAATWTGATEDVESFVEGSTDCNYTSARGNVSGNISLSWASATGSGKYGYITIDP